jgi:peptidoglycan/LPS O-acetylase OafA/YrhL
MNSIVYRREIDGIRALAILSVLAYHFGGRVASENAILSGGYLGVDVFFVISGFLICTILRDEVDAGKFTFLSFMERRVRRIVPALLFVMIVCIPISFVFLDPKSILDYSGSALSALFFGSNFFFYFDNGYYGDPSLLKPLLHTWSLAVEWQFYAIFSLVYVFILRRLRKYSAFFIISIFSLSLALTKIFHGGDFDANFYLIPTRLWEFMAGSFVAVSGVSLKKCFPRFVGRYAPVIAFSVLVSCFFLFNERTFHPSFMTLVPVICVCILIVYSDECFLTKFILGNRISVYIGLISYSLYLWHYPVMAFVRIGHDIGRLDIALFVCVAVIGMSVFSYYGIEKPFRRNVNIKGLWLFCAVAYFVIGGWSVFVFMKDGFQNRVATAVLGETIQEPWLYLKDEDGKNCFGDFGKKDFCSIFTHPEGKTVLIVGDSTLESISVVLYGQLVSSGYNVVSMNSSGCYFLPEFDSTVGGRLRFVPGQPCDAEYQKKRLDKILEFPGSIVIIGGILDHYLDGTNLSFENFNGMSIEEGYRKWITFLLDRGYKVLQLFPTPRFDISVGKGVSLYIEEKTRGLDRSQYQDVLDKKEISLIGSYPVAEFENKTASVRRLFSEIHNPMFRKLDISRLFCGSLIKDRCISNNGSQLYFIDEAHLSGEGAKLVSDIVIEALAAWNRSDIVKQEPLKRK